MPPTDPPRKPADPANWRRRAAVIEVNRRRVNEAIERGESGPAPVFLCECGRPGCSESLRVSIDDYERVRADFDRFLLIPGHEIPEVEEIVERAPGHLVVAKIEPEAEVARQTYERER